METISRVEMAASSLYEAWAKRFEGDAEASFLFYRISLEEKAHAQLAEYCRMLVAKHGGEFPDIVETPMEEASFLRMVHESSGAKSLKEAVEAAWNLEANVGEAYLNSKLARLGDGFVQQMIQVLANCGHAESLAEFLAARGWKKA